MFSPRLETARFSTERRKLAKVSTIVSCRWEITCMAGNDFRFDSYQIYKQDARRSGNKFRYMSRYGMPYRKRFNSRLLFVLPVSTCFPPRNNTLQKLHHCSIYRAFRDHSPLNAAIPPVTPHEYRRFPACG